MHYDEFEGQVLYHYNPAEQPAPITGKQAFIKDLVVQDIQKRAEAGKLRYGTYLQANNGRDALKDAYEEALDLAMYLRQLMEESVTASTSAVSAEGPAHSARPKV